MALGCSFVWAKSAMIGTAPIGWSTVATFVGRVLARDWQLLLARGKTLVPERALASVCERADVVVSERYRRGHANRVGSRPIEACSSKAGD